MAGKQSRTTNEPLIVKAYSYDSDQLILEGGSSGQVEKFVVLPGVEIKQICKFGNDVTFVYRSKTDKKKGGVVVFDPITKNLKQQIDTLAVWSCNCDGNYLTVGGWENGMVYIFQRLNDEFQLIKSMRFHGNYTVHSVALNVSMKNIISVGTDKKAIVSNLNGDVLTHHDLPARCACAAINTELCIAVVGCYDGSVVIIDLINSNVKLTINAHGGKRIYTIATRGETLFSGGCDDHVIKWKINQTSTTTITLTQMWKYKCKDSPASLYLYLDQVFVNVYYNNTIAINTNNGKLEREYSRTETGLSLVVIGDDDAFIPDLTAPPATTVAALPLFDQQPALPTSATLKTTPQTISAIATSSPSPSTGASPSLSTEGRSTYASRLTVMEAATNATLNPIFGLKQTPLVSLADSLNGLSTPDIPDLGAQLKGAIYLAKKGCKNTPAPLTDDEAAAINIYTMETPLYGAVNAALRNADRNEIKQFFKYLKLLLTALYKLPAETLHVYRGVKMSLPSSMKKGEELLWWSLTSTTSTMDVLSNPVFLGQTGDRVMFNINAIAAINIKNYSAIKGEDEYLLFPGTCLEVKGVLTLAPGLYNVELQQIDAPPFLDFVHPALNN